MKILEVGADYFGLYGMHLRSLTAQDKHTRFGYAVKDEIIDQLILNMLYHQRDHFLFVAQVDGDTAGFGHLARDGEGWELAVSVESQFQSRGIGNAIVSFMVKWGQMHGIKSVYMHCIRENQKIQHLARKHGLQTMDRSGSEITARLAVPPPTAVDVIADRLVEQTRIMAQIVSLQRQLVDNFTLRGHSDHNHRPS